MKRFFSIILFFLLFLSSLYASSKTNSAVFLRINPSARTVGMGGAGNAVYGDVSGIEINPASLLWVTEPQLFFSHNKWFLDISMNYLAYAKPIGKRWVVAISGKQLKIGEMDERDDYGDKTGTFDAGDSAYTITITRKFSSKLAIGYTGKYINQEIATESGSSFASDFGFVYNFSRFWNFGGSVRNIGNDLAIYKKAYPLPLTYSAGLGYYSPGKYHLGLDVEKEINCSPIYKTGIDYFLTKKFDIRAGYNYTEDEYASSGICVGFGLETTYNIFIDYAYVPFGDLGDTHRVSLKILFY